MAAVSGPQTTNCVTASSPHTDHVQSAPSPLSSLQFPQAAHQQHSVAISQTTTQPYPQPLYPPHYTCPLSGLSSQGPQPQPSTAPSSADELNLDSPLRISPPNIVTSPSSNLSTRPPRTMPLSATSTHQSVNKAHSSPHAPHSQSTSECQALIRSTSTPPTQQHTNQPHLTQQVPSIPHSMSAADMASSQPRSPHQPYPGNSPNSANNAFYRQRIGERDKCGHGEQITPPQSQAPHPSQPLHIPPACATNSPHHPPPQTAQGGVVQQVTTANHPYHTSLDPRSPYASHSSTCGSAHPPANHPQFHMSSATHSSAHLSPHPASPHSRVHLGESPQQGQSPIHRAGSQSSTSPYSPNSAYCNHSSPHLSEGGELSQSSPLPLQIPKGRRLWRETSLGQALTDALQELVEDKEIEIEESVRIMDLFDNVATDAIPKHSESRSLVFKMNGKMQEYKNIDGAWMLTCKNFRVRDRHRIFISEGVKIIAAEPSQLNHGSMGAVKRWK
eukprot:GHVN01048859.1.p1 GENE.GHVN01048859.1~~GHVN01048859.1.p1  ORF type:complete len:501 (+),score=115.32 GHVN01048859.1:352-1854(+)